MILGKSEEEIIKLAIDNQSEMFDGVVQYNYKSDKLIGASFSTGTIENPANPYIEIFRLNQGKIEYYDCNDCPYDDEEFINRMKKESPNLYTSKEECCKDAYFDELLESFYDDFDNYFRDGVEIQIREVLSDHLESSISKLNEIRIELSDRFEPWNYVNVRQENWEMDILDFYVDNAIENGFTTTVSPRDWLDAEIESICLGLEEDNEYIDFMHTLRDGDFDGALELLQ